MAESRYNRPRSSNKKNAEAAVLEWLSKTNHSIPKRRKDFATFIYKHFDSKEVTESALKSIWIKLHSVEKKIEESPTIVVSSDEEMQVQVTEIFDFDELNSENEPNITLVQVPQLINVNKTPEKKKREYCRNPVVKVKESSNNAEDQALFKKFKERIILNELLERDKQMLQIQQKTDKFQTAVQIEMGYAQRIQKERVDALANEMLRLHKAGYRDGLSLDSLAKSVCLMDPPKLIPSEQVIAEILPSPDPHTDPFVQELTNDQINYEMVYPSGEGHTSDQSCSLKRISTRHSDPTRSKRVKKKKSLRSGCGEFNSKTNSPPTRSKEEVEADELRQKLFIDKLIEITLPEVVMEINGNIQLRPTC